MERTDAVVAGAGAVGLAIARALAMTGREVMVLESESAIGTATSSRNSEVIHAGIYYPPEMLKTCLCVEGRVALYRYCKEKMKYLDCDRCRQEPRVMVCSWSGWTNRR
jgi:L-2-hydroxyglutarate oxidase LhgO